MMRATFVLPAIVALSLVGCATAPNAERTNANQLFASAGPYRDNDLADNKIIEPDENKGYRLGFVEFDEQGWLLYPSQRQLLQVQHLVAREARLVGAPGQRPNGIILVAFVHGWQHNAARDDANVESFRNLLAEMARVERGLPVPRKIVGVYLGWPGLSLNAGVLTNLTFYSRKNTGDRVGYYGGVTDVLGRLEKLHNEINDANPQNRSYYVVAGHSFGAQVVYNSLANVVTQRLVEARISADIKLHRTKDTDVSGNNVFTVRQVASPNDKPVKPFGDLIVLVNPAFEAARYHNLKTLSEQFPYPDAQRPVLAIFGSETDKATKLAFPAGRFFSTMFQRYRDGEPGREQAWSNVHTIPWTDRYVTHQLGKTSDTLEFSRSQPTSQNQKSLVRAPNVDSNSPARLREVMVNWDAETRAGALELADCFLVPKHTAVASWTPFYVVKVKPSLVDGHSDIWRAEFRNFLAQFITISLRHTD
ncbi:MAG: hypothetical protein HY736_06580 [Verrucomicrobia bacterium]|nr:hypothetical protein [Verrucomicrobiota bacterium]